MSKSAASFIFRYASYIIITLLPVFAWAQSSVLKPGEQLITEGMDPVPLSLVSDVNRYTNARSASFSDWHPLRRELLMSTRFGNTNQLHLLRFPLGARTQLTFFDEPVGGATYEPVEGRYFIFSRDAGGNEFAQLYRYDVADGKITLLTDGGRSQNGGMRWSNKGDRLLYGSTRRNGADRDIWLMDPMQPGKDSLVLALAGGGWGVYDWAPDDGSFVMGERLSVNDSRLWLVDLKGGQKKRISPESKEQVVFESARFSADGKSLYIVTDMEDEFQYLASMELSSGKINPLTRQIRWDVSGYALSPDGKHIVFSVNEAGISKMYLMETSSGSYSPIREIPEGSIGGFSWHENGEEVGFTWSSATSSADIFSYNVKTFQLTRLTESELGGLRPEQLNGARLIKWRSFDGVEISGFYYQPPAKFTGRRPLIISSHGGPEGQSTPGFQGRNNYYLNELGIALIYPNVRGSTGYGKTFVKMDNGYLRENSVKDIGALLDWIATNPELDPQRVMTMGGSYGGYMALACAVMYSDRLRCSNDIVGISNFNTFLRNTESYRRDLRRVEYGNEQDSAMASFLERISPLNNVNKIKIPMFIVQGGNDPRVPRTEAVQMFEALRKNDVPAWYLEAKDEGHGFKKKNNADYQFYSTILFVKKYLLGE